MVRRKKALAHGTGAVCSVLLKRLHPAKLVQRKFPNATAKQRLDDLTELKEVYKTVNGKEQKCIVMYHEKFGFHAEVYAVKRWIVVMKEGDDGFGDSEEEGSDAGKKKKARVRGEKDDGEDNSSISIDQETVSEDEEPQLIPDTVRKATKEDIRAVKAQGFDVDDDNEPLPENVPNNNDDPTPANINIKWGWSGFDRRKQEGFDNPPAKFNNLGENALTNMTTILIFRLLFPFQYLERVILPVTNKFIEGKKATIGELLRFIGLWFYMASFQGFSRSKFWSQEEIDDFDGTPVRFHQWMKQQRFINILTALDYFDGDAPAYTDKFYIVRDLIQAWNQNMKSVFTPSWVSCLDESMSPWTSKWTCPGWMFVPRKPHPMGNEYHTICCGSTGIMYAIDLVEGKDAPPERVDPVTREHGATTALLLRLCSGIISRGMVVILDSGFCVLKGLIQLRKVGVFASAVIKKRRYWPKFVPGDQIENDFDNKQVGDCDCIDNEMDGVKYSLFVMKDVDYTMKLMSTYGGLAHPEDAKMQTR